MAVTADDLRGAGIPLKDTPDVLLYAMAAIDWIKANTILEVDVDDIQTIEALPYAAKLFILKFTDIIFTDRHVTSESLGGMSQSFNTENWWNLLWDLAQTLLSAWLKSQVSFSQAKSRWQGGNREC